MSVTIRPATAADFIALRGKAPPVRVRAWSGEADGRLVAIWGVAWGLHGDAAPTAFLEGAADARRDPVAMHRAALRMLEDLRAAGLRTIALAVSDHPKAKTWAWRLGFRPVDDSELWLWRT